MKRLRPRRLLQVAAVFGLLLAPTARADASAPSPRAGAPVEALLIGDSVMNGMAQSYGAPGRALLAARHSFILDAAGCRRLITTSCRIPPSPAPTDALAVLRARAGQYNGVLVIGAGYDDPTSGPDGIGAAVETILAEAHRQSIRTIVWLTYREAGSAGNLSRFRAHNAVLRQAAMAHPDLVLADWNGVSQTLPSGSFSADGIHLGASATTAMARLIADTLDTLPRPSPPRCAAERWTGTQPSDAPAELGAPSPGGVHVVSPPVRLVDTRTMPGVLGAGQILTIPIAGVGGVAMDATAALVTITVVEPCSSTFVAAYPCDAAAPATSVVNADTGTVVANAALVRLGGGRLCLTTSQPTDVLVDLTGWVSSGGLTTEPAAPARLVDTRPGNAEALPVAQQRLRGGSQLALDIGAVAAAGTAAVTLNLTAAGPAGDGFLTLLPGPCSAGAAPPPSTSTVNVVAGHDAAASATVGAGNGEVCVYSSVDTDVVVDLQATHGPSTAADLVAIDPVRLADSRGTHRLAPGEVIRFPLDALGQVPAALSGAVINVTAVDPSANGFLVVFGCGAAVPTVSSVNTTNDVTVANRAAVALGADRAVCVTSSIDTDVVLDVEAWVL